MTTSLTIRMDETLKSEAKDFFEDIGMDLTTAVTCFFKKCLADGEIPFTLSRPRKRDRLAAALAEAKHVATDPTAPACNDPADLETFLLR